MFSRYFIAVAALLCFSQAAFAADDIGLSKEYSVCMDRANGITENMIECFAAETKKQDARLNKVYKELMNALSPARKNQLKEAQRAWIKFRDANVSYCENPEGGSIARINSNRYFMSATAARAKELEDFREMERLEY
ncbi:MAG: lysozyme inhibitor LprI family protein [Desulfococcaceae bacterium]